ncbi:MAG TPA: glycosyl hydrolase family 18 protein [Bacillota bacterium]|jgi:spore germination protein YaaH|nr:glycosyl hydrolase family 18 protein [Peptococcaceae bacterium MAG4]NLW36962.1 glycoside hydrolase [Peptococcaceae bacterium]HPZ42670.1 glycosyl hydrolase family 18 protein [Bacillota bacterium]HQD75686.1 glycosyl hydrolase family 18 protein [Bacillota bacterium]HUM57956.1 glycosyl hydrolase family 18 protein [Bacillota bacterium]
MKKQPLAAISFTLILLALLGGLILCSAEESLAAEPGNELSPGTTLAAVPAFEKAPVLPADGITGGVGGQLLVAKGSPEAGSPGEGESVSGTVPKQPASGDSQPGTSQSKLNRIVLGYYTEYYPGDNLSYNSLLANHASIDYIATFSYLTDGRGNLTGTPITTGVELAKNKGVKSLMLVHNISNAIDSDAAHTLLSVPENRMNFEKNILSLIKEHGFDGVNIDLEGVPAADRSNYSTLLKELKEMLEPAGYLLTVSIPAKTRDNPLDNWNGAYDYTAIGEYADLVTLMTYDEHWPGGYPGPVASLSWVQQVLDYAVKSIPREKILMGVAAYGYNWSSAGGASTVLWNRAGTLASRNGGARWNDQYSAPYLIYYDQRGYRHEVWFENRFSLAIKLDLVNSYDLGGIAVWRLGFEDASFWQTVVEKISK